jgi:hypothetical protein
MVDLVRESVRVLVLEVIFQVVNMHVASGERFSRSNVEVSDHLVDLDATLKTTALLSLSIEVLGVVFALALLYTLATTERPGYRGVCVANLVAGVAAAGLEPIGWRGRTIAFSAVVWCKMLGFILVSEALLVLAIEFGAVCALTDPRTWSRERCYPHSQDLVALC